jgi:hypothetical protein
LEKKVVKERRVEEHGEKGEDCGTFGSNLKQLTQQA